MVLRDRLKLHAAALRGLLHTSTGELVSPPAFSSDNDCFNDIRALESHITELEERLGGTAPAFNFEPAQTSAPAAIGKKLTLSLTQKVCEARRVKNLAELSKLPLDSTD